MITFILLCILLVGLIVLTLLCGGAVILPVLDVIVCIWIIVKILKGIFGKK